LVHSSSCSSQAQADLSTAIGLTMPQHTQQSLIHVLLLWTTILSIVQVAFIIFFFTDIQNDDSKKTNTQLIATFLSPTEANSTKWLAKNPDTNLASEKGEVLTINKDGYYFLNLQVTLCSCKELHTVQLQWNKKVIVHGWINNNTCSTGLLGKVEELFAGGTLEVIVSPKMCIRTAEALTHLGIIYMRKP
uniref:TNF family profile domain-containing protein n=1 Tax=Seriola lalandi dorsalis TaxID=1841481 RepID=A0A3B4WI76_SERLL